MDEPDRVTEARRLHNNLQARMFLIGIGGGIAIAVLMYLGLDLIGVANNLAVVAGVFTGLFTLLATMGMHLEPIQQHYRVLEAWEQGQKARLTAELQGDIATHPLVARIRERAPDLADAAGQIGERLTGIDAELSTLRATLADIGADAPLERLIETLDADRTATIRQLTRMYTTLVESGPDAARDEHAAQLGRLSMPPGAPGALSDVAPQVRPPTGPATEATEAPPRRPPPTRQRT